MRYKLPLILLVVMLTGFLIYILLPSKPMKCKVVYENGFYHEVGCLPKVNY
jgi:hypothetical protein